MMKPKRVVFTPVTQAAGNIAASQTPAGAVNLTLNGALASGGRITDLGMAYILGFTSAGNLSARSFVITGTNADGAAQTETVVGPNVNTVLSTKFWRTVTSIAIDAAAAAALTVETQNTTLSAVSQTFPVDIYEQNTQATVIVTGVANFTIQKCSERPTAGETPNWRTLQAAGAVNVEAAQTVPIGGIRLQLNSYTNGATLAMSILQTAFARSY